MDVDYRDLVIADYAEALRQVSELVADLAHENFLLRHVADRALRQPYQKKTVKDDEYDRLVDEYRYVRERVFDAGEASV